MKTVPLVGYSDKLSGRPGERINFMVSSEHKEDFTAELFRSISADPNPQGLGVFEQSCDEFFTKKSESISEDDILNWIKIIKSKNYHNF